MEETRMYALATGTVYIIMARRVTPELIHVVVTNTAGDEVIIPVDRTTLAVLQQIADNAIVGYCLAHRTYRASEAGRLKINGQHVWVCPECAQPLLAEEEFPF
jgi:hypothetical protein